MLTILNVVQKTTEFFTSKGVENPRLNAELIVGHALGLKRMQLYIQFERPLTETDLEKIRPLVRRRAQREPIQYIFGETEWSGLKLKVDRRALIPRPETEYLIELIAARVTEPPKRILDLGTGSGAIALALASRYAAASVVATDRSVDALELAKDNASALGLTDRVQFRQSLWFESLAGEAPFDLVVSNPPYLTRDERENADPEVKEFEPESALVAESAGTADLDAIIGGAKNFLTGGALLALETGVAQHNHLTVACTKAGLVSVESIQDLTGRDRFIFARATGT